MKKQKDFKQRLSDLNEHATLLSEACERFFNQHKTNEVRNIASRLRTLVCIGRSGGDNLFIDLTRNSPVKIWALKSYAMIILQEIDPVTGVVVQDARKRKLFDKIEEETLPILTTRNDYSPWLEEVLLEEWLESGILLDWEVPNDLGQTPIIETLSPRKLIKAYADTEGSHSDNSYAKVFGSSVEILKESYIFNDKPMTMPVVYNYLYQIGNEVAKVALSFCERNQ